jgi:hypothetical protein
MLGILLGLPGSFVVANSAPASAAGRAANFCNRTKTRVSVAIGYYSTGVADAPNASVLTGPFVSVGWYNMDAGTCTTAENPFNVRYMFWWVVQNDAACATSSCYNNPAAGVAWAGDGNAHFCIPDLYGPNPITKFTFEDENVSLADCQNSQQNRNGNNVWVPVRRVDLAVDPNVNIEI